MNTASLKGATTQGLRAITVGGFLLASLGICAAADAHKTQKVEKKTVKKEVVSGELAETTILANRTETDLSKVGSSVTVLDTAKLKKEGVRFFSDALKFVPGVISDTSSGQRGTVSSIFIRGNASAYTGMMVDGIRMGNSAFGGGFNAKNFIGTSGLTGTSNLEILKGPQGVVYGGSAIAGVVAVSNSKGEGPMSGDLMIERGSFNTWNTMFGVQGESGAFAYSLNLGYESTDNDLPNNEFEAFSAALRLDYEVNDAFRVGLTLRVNNSTSDSPKFSDPKYPANLEANYDYTLTTFFAEYDVNDIWSSKLTLGLYDQNYNTKSLVSKKTTYDVDSDRFTVYWDNTITWNDQFVTVAGLAYDRSEYKDQKTPALSKLKRSQFALYLNQIWDVTDDWTITGGVRWEDYKDKDKKNGYNGEVTTWRFASAYTVPQTKSIIRASVGTGLQIPTFYQVYRHNPINHLDEVKSIGWDVGIEQPFLDDQCKVGVTYFSTRVKDAIDYSTWNAGGPVYTNRNQVTETSGLEMFVKANFLDDRLSATLTYTWLDRQTLKTPKFLPENVLSLRVDGKLTDQINVGIDATYTGHRALYGNPLKSYTLVNLYANYQLNENVRFNVRVENLFDKNYFYEIAPAWGGGTDKRPGRGAGIFAGVTLSF